MARKGRDYEKAIQWLVDLDPDKYTVTSPAFLYDPLAETKREIDILIEYDDQNGIKRKCAVECRDRAATQDVTWIEQLATKKNDLELDFIVAITPTAFSKAAINKAAKYGILLEVSEEFTSSSFKTTTDSTFFCDVYFAKLCFEKLSFGILGEGIKSYREYIRDLNVIEKEMFKQQISLLVFSQINPLYLLKTSGISYDVFFDNTKDNSMIITKALSLNEANRDSYFATKRINMFSFSVKLTPYRLTLPLFHSLSTFTTEKKNKRYHALFENGDNRIEIAFSTTEENYWDIHFSNIPKLNFLDAEMHINTIIPNLDKEPYLCWDNLSSYIGQFDFKQIE